MEKVRASSRIEHRRSKSEIRQSRATQFLVMVAGAFILAATAIPTLLVIRSKEPEARSLLHDRFSQLALGDTKHRVEAVLGRPETICLGPDGLYPHQMPGLLFFDRNTAHWKALAEKTTERWIYPLPYEEVGSIKAPKPETREYCRPRYAEGEVAFDSAGAVLWFIALTDEDYVTYRLDSELNTDDR